MCSRLGLQLSKLLFANKDWVFQNSGTTHQTTRRHTKNKVIYTLTAVRTTNRYQLQVIIKSGLYRYNTQIVTTFTNRSLKNPAGLARFQRILVHGYYRSCNSVGKKIWGWKSRGKREPLNCVGVFPSPRLFSDVTDYNLFCNFTDSLEIFTRIFEIFRLSSKCNTKCTRMILFVTLKCVNDCLTL